MSIESVQYSMHFLFPFVMFISWRFWLFLTKNVQKHFSESEVFQAYIETMISVFIFFVINLILWNIFLLI